MANIQERRDKTGKLISYSIRVHRGRGADGKQLKPWTATFDVSPTWTEKSARKKAEAFAATFEAQCKSGLVADTRQTLAEYLDYCIDLKVERGLKVSTETLYRSLSEKRIKPAMGYIKLRELRPEHINKLYSDLGKDGMNRKTGGKLSAKTILEVHRLLHTALEQAVREGLIPYNPADRVELPKSEKKEAIFYDQEDIEKIFNALESEPIQWRTLVNLLLVSGCRRGEALGLKWEDVDFDNSRIHIVRNVLYVPQEGVYVDTPKTKKSVRWISLPSESMEDLKRFKAWQTQERLRLGAYYKNEDYLFTQENGSPLHPTSVTAWLRKLSQKHEDLPHLNPHSFRHSMTALLIYGGMDPVAVSRRLGHSLVSTTTDVYSHMFADADSRSSDIISDALFRKKA